jgi:uncharacterized coiled-coil protein SlyX
MTSIDGIDSYGPDEGTSNTLFQIAIVALAVTRILAAGITWVGTHLITKQQRTRIVSLEKELAEQKLQFETFKTLTSNEFELTWKSIAQQNNNFKALTHGFHLCEEDIAEDDSTSDAIDRPSDSSDGEMQ